MALFFPAQPAGAGATSTTKRDRCLPTTAVSAQAAAATRVVEDVAEWKIHAPDARDVLAAIRFHSRHRISFWDAMIVQSATQLGCDVLYSADLNAGQRYDGVLVVDPFA